MSHAPMSRAILLTIDVEDWFQVENLRPWFPPSAWHAQSPRVEASTHRLLDLFDAFDYPVKATFFVLGLVAEKHPRLVREIYDRGHEIASHGYGHMLCNQMDRQRLLEDLRNSKNILEALVGKEVVGYRAPNFSIDDEILKCVHECGYRYDASYNSFEMHGRYGRISSNGYKRRGIALQLRDDFFELPVSNLKLAGQVIPWSGGGYFRLLPPVLFNAGIRYALKNENTYHLYLHPWEVDPGQPKQKEAKGFKAWRHYLNLHKTYPRLKRLIATFNTCQFLTCRQYLKTV
jgi:polysaccharide deacetylase family protein (PEP-CTERM system associated)